jgi:hypothetical protein
MVTRGGCHASPRMILRRDTIKPWRSILPALFLGVSLFGAYLYTLAPGLTWANGGSDGGDLISAAAGGGIAHPTGYPLYLLLARLFQLLPVGSLAYRTNLMSAFFSAAASVLICVIVVRQLAEVQTVQRILAGLAAGFCFGLSPLVWSQAVITEVYGLQAFLVVLILYLYSVPDVGQPGKRKWLDGWRGLTLGLAMGNHVTTLLLVPLALLVGAVRPGESGRQNWLQGYRLDLRSLGRQLLGLALGLGLYLILPLRAMSHPAVNWGNPVSLPGFIWLVSGQLYQSYYLQIQFTHVMEQTRSWARFAVLQLGLLGVFLGLLGLIVFGRASRLFILTAGLAAATLAFSFVYRPADAEVYLMPLLVSFSVWLGIGSGRLADFLSRYSQAFAVGAGLLILGMILFRSLSIFPQVDASRDSTAEAFGQQVLSQAPQSALLFAEGDRAIFALWYFHFALGERPDLVVIARDLVPFDWYQETLRSTYPSLSVAGPIVFPETIMRDNPGRPACQVKYEAGTQMECAGEK